MILTDEEYLAHYGTPRKSGRYAWGSGGDAPQNSRSFLDTIKQLRRDGLTESQIAKSFDLTTTELRAATTIANNETKQEDIAMAQRLKDKGYSNVAIAERMGKPESTIRNLLKPGEQEKADNLKVVSNMLKEQVAEKTYVDVGKGVERQLGVSREKLDTALAILKADGEYVVHNVQVAQVGSKNKTTIKVLAPPGTTYKDIVGNPDKIQQIRMKSSDGGRSFLGVLPPLSISSSRLAVRYGEEGGEDADGVIYVRPGVKDISLGKARYAQVRVAIDGTHYLKGMAMYKDDLPNGVDLVFNTNKSRTGNKLDALKPMKDDKDNPFGSVFDQITERDSAGNVRVTSAMNLVNEEGDWDKWSKSLSSQMLSKQSPRLAQEQLAVTYTRRKSELDTILSLTNPEVRRKLLETYADSVDSAAVHLKAAALPRQRSQVILPIKAIKETEIYAPNFRNGERVVLIRHPHGGIFEIPELTVNNRNQEARKILGQATDAVGIHSEVAKRLSGADFDGDTVLVIPNSGGRVKTAPALEGLKNFDPKREFPKYEGMPVMTERTKQAEMGRISNLITDMTIRKANPAEIAQAVRHSMVVIDAVKWELDYKASARQNNIAHLKRKYQGGASSGASTIVSRASSRIDVRARKARPASLGGPIDPVTGKKVYVDKGEPYVNAKGKLVYPTQRSKKLAETDDAHTLSSGTVIEKVYADHSNRLKALANEARLASLSVPSKPRSPSAAKVYASEVSSINHKLNVALMNAPLERQAQLVANAVVKAKRDANPDMDSAEVKKLSFLAITEARNRLDSGKSLIDLTDTEWEAIQAGAISPNKLKEILNNSDLDRLKKLAMPKTERLMDTAAQSRAKSMLALGYDQAEVADALGVSLSTLKLALNGG